MRWSRGCGIGEFRVQGRGRDGWNLGFRVGVFESGFLFTVSWLPWLAPFCLHSGSSILRGCGQNNVKARSVGLAVGSRYALCLDRLDDCLYPTEAAQRLSNCTFAIPVLYE